MKTLSEEEVVSALEALPGWTLTNGTLAWQRRFADFSSAFAFVTRVALLAERADHHPDVTLEYDRLKLRLISHDAGGITTRDIEMAKAIGKLASR